MLGFLCLTGSIGWGYPSKDTKDVDLRGVFYRDLLGEIEGEEIIKRKVGWGIEAELVLWSADRFFRYLKKVIQRPLTGFFPPVFMQIDCFKKLDLLPGNFLTLRA